MSPSNRIEFDRNSDVLDAEQTLRLIATLPAPPAIEDRIKASLQSAPYRATVIEWPQWSSNGARWMHSAGMRAAAAAAIVLVVAGGGWGIYSRIHLPQAPSAVAAPHTINGGGSFNAAGARRVPQTLQKPVIAAPVISKQKQDASRKAMSAKKQGQAHGKTTAVPVDSVK